MNLLWRKGQLTFKIKIHEIRNRQLWEAHKRSLAQAAWWQGYLEGWRQYRQALYARMCPDCEWKPCQCLRPADDEFLRDVLRKLAGLNPHSDPRVTVDEWSDWNRGPEGFRKCGPSGWDNAVRCWEEDR